MNKTCAQRNSFQEAISEENIFTKKSNFIHAEIEGFLEPELDFQ